MVDQSKGSASRLVFDWEASFKEARSKANRKPIIMPYNTCDVKATRALNASSTLRGDRNPIDPYQGNKSVAGNITIPVDMNVLGYLLKAAVGAPVTVDAPLPDVTGAAGSDIKKGSPTLTIAGGAGAYTFSADQDTGGDPVTVGDRVIYELAGVRYAGFITTKTNATTGVLSLTRDGGTKAANIAGATVIAIAQSKADATPGTVTISSGVATFSATHANLAAGQVLIYDETAPKFAIIGTVLSGTTANVTSLDGAASPDIAGKTVEWLGLEGNWQHTFKIAPTASLPSFILERGFPDLASPLYIVYAGCKIASLEITIGGDGELLATVAIVGADSSNGSTAYDDASVSDAAAAAIFTERFQQFDAAVKEGGSASSVMKEVKVNLNNNLDTSGFVIGGGGVLDGLPEGIAQVGGSISALFKDNTIYNKARANTESSLEVIFTKEKDILSILYPEVKYQANDPGVSGPGGVLLEFDFQGYKADATQASAMVAALTCARRNFN